VVSGGIHILGEGGGGEHQRIRKEALATLWDLMPAVLGESDPVPYRTVLFGLDPHKIIGRSARLVGSECSGATDYRSQDRPSPSKVT